MNTLIGLNGTIPPGCAVSTVTSPGSSTSAITGNCFTGIVTAEASASGNGTNFSVLASVQGAGGGPVFTGTSANARYVETYVVQGGSGLGVLELAFSFTACSGSAPAIGNRPVVSF